MKVFHALDVESSNLSNEDKEKIAVLKLVDVGKYVENVGIRDGQFYIIAEGNTDEIYLEYKGALNNIQALMNMKIDFRLQQQKNMEYHNKKAQAMQRIMEMPR